MKNTLLIHGRLTGPTTIELDQPISDVEGEVDVIVRRKVETAEESETVFEFLSKLPPGTRSREDIDQEIREERGIKLHVVDLAQKLSPDDHEDDRGRRDDRERDRCRGDESQTGAEAQGSRSA